MNYFTFILRYSIFLNLFHKFKIVFFFIYNCFHLYPQASYSGDTVDAASVHSRGSSDSRSRTSTEKRSRRKESHKSPGSILRHVILKGVAAQLVSYHVKYLVYSMFYF